MGPANGAPCMRHPKCGCGTIFCSLVLVQARSQGLQCCPRAFVPGSNALERKRVRVMVAVTYPAEEKTQTGQARMDYCCMLLNPMGQPRKVTANMRLGRAIPLQCQKQDTGEVYTVCHPMTYT